MKIKKILPKNFNPKAYLDLNPDVASAGVDPEYHYLNYGIDEGRKFNYISSVDLFSANTNKELFIENEYTNKYAYLNPIYTGPSAWAGHIYFVNFLVSIIKPKIFVELGIYYGFSYFNICRVMEILKSEFNDLRDSKAYGIDSFEGDVHAIYNEEDYNIEKHVNKQNINFSYFSNIIKSRFDVARSKFENKSIDLLHIDGQHLYEDVKNDFKKWEDKLSDNSVVLFHDTQIKSRDFGVYKFWDEMKDNYPSINFEHSEGLGVLFYGKNFNKKTELFIKFISNINNKKTVINFYKNMNFLTNLHSNVYLLEKSKIENIIQNVEYVKSHRIKIVILSDAIYQSNFDVRLKNIFEFYKKKRNSVIVNYFYESLFDPILIDYYDIFIFSRLLVEEQSLNFIEVIKKKGKKIIYDIDDYLIGAMPKFLKSYKNYPSLKVKVDITKQLISKANLITVSTSEMQKKLNLLNSNTYVLPNGIDKNFVDHADNNEEGSTDRLNIDLASTDTVDISMLSEALSQILDNNDCHLNVIGPISDQVKEISGGGHDNVSFHDKMSYQDFLLFLQKQKNTIGFIPLDNSEFSNCKSPVKYIHYSSLGIPCVCSNVKPYNKIIEHGFNGFLANSTEDWINYFNILKNKDTRKKIIFNAKKNILKNYTYDSLILKIDEIIKKVL